MSRAGRFATALIGLLLCVQFVALATASGGYQITFLPPYEASSPGELRLWTATAFLLFPGACLLGLAAGPWIARALATLVDRVRDARPYEWAISLAVITALYVAYARLGDSWLLNDLPITDEEYADQLGGRILASGHVMIPMVGVWNAVTKLYLYVREGRIGAMDWIGPQAAWAIAEKTQMGRLFFAMVAAIPLPCIAFVCARRRGLTWGIAGLGMLLLSPMFDTLSITTHTHVLSRAFVALAFVAYELARSRGTSLSGAALGLALGLGFCCRPTEVAMLGAPLVLALLYMARRDPKLRPAAVGVFVGAAFPLAGFLLHDYEMTGNALLPARMAPGTMLTSIEHGTPWQRFGSNVGYNTLMLSIWFLGPLGALLAGCGVGRNAYTKMLGLGIAADLAVAMIHDDRGLHIVGPIHYSECVVPLTILAVHGASWLWSLASKVTLPPSLFFGPLSAALVIGLAPMIVLSLHALGTQADVQQQIDDYITSGIDRLGPHDGKQSVVLVPRFWQIWRSEASLAPVGTWVHEWRRPYPDLRDPILILREEEGDDSVADMVRAVMPERHVYRLSLQPELSLRAL